MKSKISMLLLLGILLTLDTNPLLAKANKNQAIIAFRITFEAYKHCILRDLINMTPDGVKVKKGVQVEFKKVGLNSLNIKNTGSYKEVSGRVSVKDKNNLRADLRLKGGFIKELKWEIDDYSASKRRFKVKIIADGTEFWHRER